MTIRSGPELTVTWRWVRPLLWGAHTALWTSAITMVALSLTSSSGEVARTVMITLWAWLVVAAVPAAVLLFLEWRNILTGSGRRAAMVLAGVIPLIRCDVVIDWVRNTPAVGDSPLLLAAPAAPVRISIAVGCLAASSLVLATISLLRERGWAPVPPRPSAMRVVTAVLSGVTIVGYGVTQAHDLVREALTPVRITTSPAPDTLPPMTPTRDFSQLTGEPAWVFRAPDLKRPYEVHVGARGPIVADEDTVIGLDGATGRRLWSFERREAHLVTLRNNLKNKSRVLVSPDGRSVVVQTCFTTTSTQWRPDAESMPMLTVIDAVTGNPRFTLTSDDLPKELHLTCHLEPVVLTDHVLVIWTHAYDLVTGTKRWELPEENPPIEGPQGSSHVIVLSSPAGPRQRNCPACDDSPVTVLSDEDLSQTQRTVPIKSLASEEDIIRGWLLTHDAATNSAVWLNVDTLQRIPTGQKDGKSAGAIWRAPDTALVKASETKALPDGSERRVYHVLDPWTGEAGTVTTPHEDAIFGPVGVGVWFDVEDDGSRLRLLDPNGSLIGNPFTPAAPPGVDWKVQDYSRTHHGLVVGFSWPRRGDIETTAAVAMYR